MGINSIGYIAIILLIFFYLFAIIGMLLFQENDPWHFGTLHIAMLTLFRCATLEDWTDVMYINYWGCEMYGYTEMPNRCVARGMGKHLKWWSYFYWIFFIFIGALVLLTLFIGVVTTAMEEATTDMKEAMEVEKHVADIQKEEGVSPELLELYRTVFGILDLDGGKTIEAEELSIGLAQVGYDLEDHEINQMLSEVD